MGVPTFLEKAVRYKTSEGLGSSLKPTNVSPYFYQICLRLLWPNDGSSATEILKPWN